EATYVTTTKKLPANAGDVLAWTAIDADTNLIPVLVRRRATNADRVAVQDVDLSGIKRRNIRHRGGTDESENETADNQRAVCGAPIALAEQHETVGAAHAAVLPYHVSNVRQ